VVKSTEEIDKLLKDAGWDEMSISLARSLIVSSGVPLSNVEIKITDKAEVDRYTCTGRNGLLKVHTVSIPIGSVKKMDCNTLVLPEGCTPNTGEICNVELDRKTMILHHIYEVEGGAVKVNKMKVYASKA